MRVCITKDQMSRQPKLDNQTLRIKASGEVLERVQFFKFLVMWVQKNLKWTDHIIKIVSLCSAALSIFKKIKNLAPTALKKSGKLTR